jgi:hypothetical protein
MKANTTKATRTLALIAGLVVLAFAFTPLAGAQEKKRNSVRGKGDIKVNSFDRGRSGSVDLGVAEIEGRIFKPSVFFVLARRDFQYQGIQFRQSFLDRVVSGAMKRPF